MSKRKRYILFEWTLFYSYGAITFITSLSAIKDMLEGNYGWAAVGTCSMIYSSFIYILCNNPYE